MRKIFGSKQNGVKLGLMILHYGWHFIIMATQIFRKSGSQFKIPGARNVTCSKLHTEDSKMLCANVQNWEDWAKWRCRFVHHWCTFFDTHKFCESMRTGWTGEQLLWGKQEMYWKFCRKPQRD